MWQDEQGIGAGKPRNKVAQRLHKLRAEYGKRMIVMNRWLENDWLENGEGVEANVERIITRAIWILFHTRAPETTWSYCGRLERIVPCEGNTRCARRMVHMTGDFRSTPSSFDSANHQSRPPHDLGAC